MKKQEHKQRMRKEIIRIHLNLKEDILLLFFCVAYIFAIVYVLKPNLMSGDLTVISYSKKFSVIKSFVSVLVVYLVKQITYNLVYKKNTFVYYIIRILFLLYEIPIILSFGLFDFDNLFTFWICEIIYWLLLCAVLYMLGQIHLKKRTIRVVGIPNKKKYIRVIILSIAILGLIYSYKRIGFLNISFSLSGIYRIRAAFKENTNEAITFFKTAFGGYLCPCFIVYYFSKNKYKRAFLVVVLQSFFYFLARDKTYLFLLPISVFIGLFSKAVSKDFDTWLSRGCLFYGGGLLVAIVGFFRNTIFELITRRIQVMPAFFNYIYFDFFSRNEPIWWRQDTFLIDKLFTVVYPRSVPLQISHVYFHDLEGNPNAGMFAEAISRCGYWGVIIYPLLLGTVFILVDSFYHRADYEIKLILAVCFALSVSNDVITSTSFIMVLVMVLLGASFFLKSKDYLQ